MTTAWFDFDIRNDPVFDKEIKPFIENEMGALKAFDDLRRAHAREHNHPDITYIFHEHAERVALDVRKAAARLGQPENVQEALYWAMKVHDIGKGKSDVAVWRVLPGKPDEDTQRQRRNHTTMGLEIVERKLGNLNHPFIDLMKDIMDKHHEHMDGSGHHGLSAKDLSMPVRLCAIVESYDGYTIRRPHFGERDTTPPGVLGKMRNEPDKGAKMYDMDLFEAFEAMKLEDYKNAQAMQPVSKSPEHGPKR